MATTTMNFEAEVPQLLRLLADSIYSNPEIFLRELISNASDATDKLRYEALSNPELYEQDPDLKIRVSFDKDNRTITVWDNGIGMDKQELIDNLGTIARSGTQTFLNKLAEAKSKDESLNLIGQFGVGFYSTFVVADKVTVRTRRAGLKISDAVSWESTGEGTYTLDTIEKPERGTEIILHLKEDKGEFLDEYRLSNIIRHYSDHIPVPVVMQVEEDGNDEGESEAADEADKPVKMTEKIINQAKALWTLPRSEITKEQYEEFYKHISHAFEGPIAWTHNRVEGKLHYISLLYIRKHAPFDLMHPEAKHGIKLYVQRVFIMDKATEFMPRYLRFVEGVIDSSDLPLNVSREILQVNSVVDKIKAGCVSRILGLLESMAEKKPEKYRIFWEQFGVVMKEGPGEDFANKDRIAKLLRFSSTHTDSKEQTVSLADYVSRMKDKQDKIYYITAEGFAAAKNSPHLEAFRKRGIEVLLLSDRVDEWLTAHLTEFDGKPLQSVAKGSIDFAGADDSSEENKEKQKQAEDEFSSVVKQMKDALGESVKDVRLTSRLTDSPACLVADEADMGANLQRMLKSVGQPFPVAKPILELNPDHSILQRLKSEQDDERFKEWSHVLFDQALLAEGGHLEDPATFVKRLNKLMLEG